MGTFKNIITLGAAYRVEKKIEEYEIVEKEYRKLYEKYVFQRNKIDIAIKKLTSAKINGVRSLDKLSRITEKLLIENYTRNQPNLSKSIDKQHIKKLSEVISSGQATITAVGGISTGLGTALGTWALVSSLGVASTGTAIGSISGVAASNATLAWLGGGSLAAGGGGIAAGMTAMTGLFAIPAIVFTGVFSHMSANKKIQKMNDSMIEMNKAIPLVQKELIQVNKFVENYYIIIIETTSSIVKVTSMFNETFYINYKRIYKIRLLSRFKKWFRKKVLRKNYYSEEDNKYINTIVKAATDLVGILNKELI